jgi:hypothetical protein
MSNYYLHFERFTDGTLLHIGICDDNEDVKIFNVVKYDGLNELAEDFILYVSKNKTQDVNLYFHNYKDDKELINDYIREVEGVIIKSDDNSKNDKDKGNNSGKPTIFLFDSRAVIDKDLDEFTEEFKLDIKNESVVNQSFFTQDNYNKSVPISEYTSGLSQTEIKSFDTFIEEKQEDIKNSIDLITPPPVVDETQLTIQPIPTNIPVVEPTPQYFISLENLKLTEDTTSDNFTFNPTNILIESTSTNTLLLKKGLEQTL